MPLGRIWSFYYAVLDLTVGLSVLKWSKYGCSIHVKVLVEGKLHLSATLSVGIADELKPLMTEQIYRNIC